MSDETQGNQTLPKLSEIMPEDQVVQCDCQCASFFDWGIQVVNKTDLGQSPRNKDYALMSNVKICVNCLKPIVIFDGTPYDASEYVTPEQIEALIQSGKGEVSDEAKPKPRTHAVPVSAMDP